MFYSGSRLAPDLSLPALRRRWSGAPVTDMRAGTWTGATRATQRATARLRGPAGGESPAAIAHAAGDMLTVIAGLPDTSGSLIAAAELGERAGHLSHFTRSGDAPDGSAAVALQRAARGLLRRSGIFPGEDSPGLVALTVALAALLVEISRWQQAQHRPHQAAAAREAARVLGAYRPTRTVPTRQLVLDLRPARLQGSTPDRRGSARTT